MITRSEAVHRLKIITSTLNGALSAIREGHWQEGSTAAEDAAALLDSILPHLEEAAQNESELVGSLKYGAPPPAPVHAMGYRGNGNRAEAPRFTVPPKPIVTPPPVAPKLAPPEDLIETETLTFDLMTIMGTAERLSTDDVPEMDYAATRRFDALPVDLQEKVTARYRATGKPVTIKLRKAK